jgi:autophagy-related protein 11
MDRLRRAPARAHDRALRDHIAEADGDRAMLERQFSELRARADDAARQLQDARGAADVAAADAAGLREELARVEQQLRDACAAERAVRYDLRAGRASASAYETRLDDNGRLLAQMLDVALAFRATHLRALAAAQTIAAHPGAVSKTPPMMGDSVFSAALLCPDAD